MSKGLGDTISALVESISRGKIRECGGCKKRKEWLNRKVQYSPKSALNLLFEMQRKRMKNGN